MTKRWLITTILTFITVCAWVVFDILLHARAKVDISPKIQEIIEPISPEFNTSSFNRTP